MGNGTNGTAMQTYRTPKSAARKAKAIRRQNNAWAQRASHIEVTYTCICTRNPTNCRATDNSLTY